MKGDHQLFRILPASARIAIGVDERSNLMFRSASGLPCMYWPDDGYCFEANAYLVHLFSTRKLSRRNNGGSLKLYASRMTHLIRFVHRNGISVLQMSDSRFEQFMNGLAVERGINGQLVRNANTIRSIGSRCIDFIDYTAKYFSQPNFVGEEGILRAVKLTSETDKTLLRKGRGIKWYHESFPSAVSERKRFPISDLAIIALRKAADKRGRSIARRNKALLSVLEYTGSRRGEAACLRVEDVLEAYRSQDIFPSIRLLNLKLGEDSYRLVPVPRAIVATWVDYIESTRKRIALQNLGPSKDHGFVFINHYTAQPLSVNTVTNEIHHLKKVAELTGPAHAHLFRHRFITEQFKRIIMEYDSENKDSLRAALINPIAIMQQVQQWTGHMRIESLERYIHLAFRDISKLDEKVLSALFASSIRAGAKLMNEIEGEYDTGLIAEEDYKKGVARIFKNTLSAFKASSI
ncbi:tyrosine-type recombinase/integrase [Pseudomonas protegens]|uniref:tyrosine-type recombinase/integrase n=1 Tax=Pseudomonas protegens TaxID=380021 RepID=UPI001A90D39D|nr:site-specific integrase [Pseudomonas protegens]